MLSVVTVIAVIGIVTGLPTTNSRHRILGGIDTTIEEHPYQVAIENEGETLVCGGSILAPKIIISAAHPFHDDYNQQMAKQNYLARVGSTLLLAGGELYKFSWRQIQVHPRYGEDHIFDYDVVIIILQKEIEFSLKAEPIPLIESGKEIADGTKLIVTGYGSSSLDEKYPEKLQVATIEKQNRDLCTSLQGVNITDRMLCVGCGIPTPYYGDSGGPLVNMERKLVGIVSWGKPVPKNKDPAVFTNIAHPAIHTFILQEKSVPFKFTKSSVYNNLYLYRFI